MRNLSKLLPKLAFKNTLHNLVIMKIPSTIKNALETPSSWLQRVVYWLNSALLLWTVTLEKHSSLIYGSGERATDSHPLGEWRVGGSEREIKKRERAGGLVQTATVTLTDIGSSVFQTV